MADFYAENNNPNEQFAVRPALVQFLAVIFDACAGGKRVEVKVRDDAGNIGGLHFEGIARHVVGADSDGFESEWTPESRLRVTAVGEFFIPLKDIEAIAIRL